MTPPEQIPTQPSLRMSQYITAGSLPTWEQIPPICQQELIAALANLLLSLPELNALLETPHEHQPETHP